MTPDEARSRKRTSQAPLLMGGGTMSATTFTPPGIHVVLTDTPLVNPYQKGLKFSDEFSGNGRVNCQA